MAAQVEPDLEGDDTADEEPMAKRPRHTKETFTHAVQFLATPTLAAYREKLRGGPPNGEAILTYKAVFKPLVERALSQKPLEQAIVARATAMESEWHLANETHSFAETLAKRLRAMHKDFRAQIGRAKSGGKRQPGWVAAFLDGSTDYCDIDGDEEAKDDDEAATTAASTAEETSAAPAAPAAASTEYSYDWDEEHPVCAFFCAIRCVRWL